jgi:hypothetical protein
MMSTRTELQNLPKQTNGLGQSLEAALVLKVDVQHATQIVQHTIVVWMSRCTENHGLKMQIDSLRQQLRVPINLKTPHQGQRQVVDRQPTLRMAKRPKLQNLATQGHAFGQRIEAVRLLLKTEGAKSSCELVQRTVTQCITRRPQSQGLSKQLDAIIGSGVVGSVINAEVPNCVAKSTERLCALLVANWPEL